MKLLQSKALRIFHYIILIFVPTVMIVMGNSSYGSLLAVDLLIDIIQVKYTMKPHYGSTLIDRKLL